MNKKELKKQFLINHFGEERLTNLLNAVDKFCEDNSIQCYELIDLASFYRKDKLDDVQNNRVITVQPGKIKSKDYLYKQLDKLNSKKYRNYDNRNGNLAEDSLAMLEIVKYLDQEKKPNVMSGYQEQISENIAKEVKKTITRMASELKRKSFTDYTF